MRRILLALLLPAAPTWAQAPACGPHSPETAALACTCGPGPHQRGVWGSGPYTGDSDVCTAALHAGVLAPEGGQVIVMNTPPPTSFTGTESNGVTSSDWGGYPSAFTFYGATTQAGTPLCRSLGSADELTCLCEAGHLPGSVWGSGPYTDDSDICTAAVHAGAVGPAGGEVTVRRAEGEDSYAGSTENGVTSNDFGSWGGSITFTP